MHNPATAEICQIVFGKDFGGMAHGDNKAVITHEEINQVLRRG
jgi:hypothetical protein